MRAAAADHAFDLGCAGRAPRGRNRRLGVAHADIGHQLGDRRADRGPVRLGHVAGMGQRRAQPLQPGSIVQGG